MEVEEDFSVNKIIQTAVVFFPFIQEDSFHHIFKLKAKEVSENLVFTSQNTIRDFLILLHWARNATSLRHLGVLFNLGKTRIGAILNEQLDFWSQKIHGHLNMDESALICNDFFLERCIGAVDGVEFEINAWIGDSFSGKKGFPIFLLFSLIQFPSHIIRCHSLKYQMVVCITTGQVMHFVGPFLGKFSDATMWKESEVDLFLEMNDLWVIGDKGYQGMSFPFLVHSQNSPKRLQQGETLFEEAKRRRDTPSRGKSIQQEHFKEKNQS